MTRERLTFGPTTHRAVPVGPRTAAPSAPAAPSPAAAAFARLESFDWAWGGLVIFSLLLFFRPHEQIPLLDAAHVGDISALLGLTAMVSLNLRRRRPITRFTPELAGILLLGVVILATVPTSFWMAGVITNFLEVYIPLALIFMLMVNAITTPRRIERLANLIVIAFGYVSVLVIFNVARGVNMLDGRATGPFDGFFENPNDLALNMAAFMPLAMINVLRPGPAAWRLLCAGISALMLVVVVLTQSRSGTIGTVAMLATFVVVARLITPATIIAAVFAGMIAVPFIPDTFWTRMQSITDESKDATGSRAERRLLLNQAMDVFLEHPITGVGMGQFQNYTGPGLKTRWHETHNVLLQLATELGILGLAIFVFLVVRAFAAAWWTRTQLATGGRTRRRPRGPPALVPGHAMTHREHTFLQTHGAAMVACLAGWFACALFASVGYNWTFYYLLGLAVAGRDVVRARTAAYARAAAQARTAAA